MIQYFFIIYNKLLLFNKFQLLRELGLVDRVLRRGTKTDAVNIGKSKSEEASRLRFRLRFDLHCG